MDRFKDNDQVQLLRDVEAFDINDGRNLIVPKGTLGTVVGVNGPLMQPSAYDVEFVISNPERYVLAWVECFDVIAA